VPQAEPFDLFRAQRRVLRSTLPALQQLIGLHLCDMWSKDSPQPYPSANYLAERCDVDRKTVLLALKGLREVGAIRVVGFATGKRGHRYDITGLMQLVQREDRSAAATGPSSPPVQDSDRSVLSAPIGPPDGLGSVRQTDPKVTQEVNPGMKPTAARASASLPMEGTPRRKRSKAAEIPLPSDWAPTEAHRGYAAKHGLNIEIEADGLRGWAEGRTAVSWNGTFTTRLANQARWNLERGGAARGARAPVAPQPINDRALAAADEAEARADELARGGSSLAKVFPFDAARTASSARST
jgi:hypothetical protein